MTENIELFRQSFRDEAREILVDLEAALLELHERRGESELIGRVFRGLHTIKGSGAMFGFEQLAAFTHNLETAFDAVRNGRLEVTGALIDLTLASLDEIKAMLEDAGGDAESQRRDDLLAKVRSLTGAPAPQQAKQAQIAPVDTLLDGPARVWRIQFRPGPDFLSNGSNPLLVLQELAALGDLSVCANFESVPPLHEMQSDRCYLSWDITLSSTATADAMRDVFIFVEDTCALTIEPRANADEMQNLAVPPQTAFAVPIENRRVGPPERRHTETNNSATSLRVPASKLDQFVDQVGELVTVQARLNEIANRRDDTEVSEVAEEIERLTSLLRESSMNLRMVPVRATFERFRRLVHDLARDLGKQVELVIEGAETELDKTVIEQLSDPLLHLIRNSMDHGIECPAVRTARGKRPTATVRLSARHAGASVLIEVADDGNGIDVAAVRQRALEKGLIEADARLSETEIFALLFQPGFSTVQQVTDVSGRGVGMDVVRKRIEGLRGIVDIANEPGKGTTITLRLPLTLAIIDGLLVRVGGASYVLPLANTLECIELTSRDVADAHGNHVAAVREEIVPYIRLREYFQVAGQRPDLEQVMVVETECGHYGFVVDEVLGDCQTVIKSLSRFYRNIQVISGATILGDGSVALILDPERLAQEAVRAATCKARSHTMRNPRAGPPAAPFRNTKPSRQCLTAIQPS
ncbi:MAG TPA: chemotaxis protein CheA [Terracidiphilus sp.]|jgi:two-component system chemotaxis sensor kinase CheA|nr:chemotaxis protein CheA [Terracidiphilus sp.]